MKQSDDKLGQQVEREAIAQLEIVRALKPLSGEARRRVLTALDYLLKAEDQVPGILARMAGKLKDR